MRAELDAIDVSAIVEYVAQRLELTVGKTELRVLFRDGRYDRGYVNGERLGNGSRRAPAGRPTRRRAT